MLFANQNEFGKSVYHLTFAVQSCISLLGPVTYPLVIIGLVVKIIVLPSKTATAEDNAHHFLPFDLVLDVTDF